MATLQKIRSKGPLLVIAIGLALFAFIAGDAWKILQPHTTQQDVGEVNGKSISAQEFQSLVEEMSDVVKMSNNTNSLTEEQQNQIKDQVWASFVNNELLETEAKKIGLTVTDAEIQSIIEEGASPILMQTPFVNQQTGAFDKDILKKFLVEYANMEKSGNVPEVYQRLGNYWKFIEKQLKQNTLAQKYQDLLTKSFISNPVAAEDAFNSRVQEADVLLTVVPFSSISDSTITVTDSEVKKLYEERKSAYKQPAESRDIKYVSFKVTPSETDRFEVFNEVTDYTNQLVNISSDYAAFVRSAGSSILFSDIPVSTTVLPADVVARLDSTTVGDIFGPYYNASDDSYNVFKIIQKVSAPDEIVYRQLQVYADTEAKTDLLTDSILIALKMGSDFAEIAKNYGQPTEPITVKASVWERSALDADNSKYINALISQPLNEYTSLKLTQANLIIQVTSRNDMKDKYKVAIVKRPVEFSKETYNKAYNNFSQFVAQSKTLEDMEKNAEEFGYSVVPRRNFLSTEHYVAGVKSTRDALKWVFEAKPGQVSPLYECGENDHLLVVALERVNAAGYTNINQVAELLKAEVRRNKKADVLLSQMKGFTSLEQAASMKDAQTDTVKHVTFSAPAYISLVRASEPTISATATKTPQGSVSAPVKGYAGVYMLQTLSTNKTEEEFDEAKEEATLSANAARYASQFIYELREKSKVVDERYLYF